MKYKNVIMGHFSKKRELFQQGNQSLLEYGYKIFPKVSGSLTQSKKFTRLERFDY